MSEPLDGVASRPPLFARFGARTRDAARAALDRATVQAHALAQRLDWVPEAFESRGAVDVSDPAAIRRGWLRQLRRWRTYCPEEVFAWKAGAAMLAGVIGVLTLVVGTLR